MAAGDFTECRILYSTQSGRAKACARRTARILAESSRQLQLQNGKGCTFDDDPWLVDFADFAQKLQKGNTLLLLFVSTTGDGEQTDTIQRTWKHLLQRSLPSDLFQGLRFCIFSLGDRAYGPQKFCAAGRKLTVRLRQLGADLAAAPGYGDDGTPNGGVFYDLDEWIQETLLPLVLPKENTQPTVHPAAHDAAIVNAPYRITVRKQQSETIFNDDDAATEEKEEWQRIEYADCYRDYFQRQCPLTAYCYDNEYNRQTDGDSAQSPPLLGHVTQNERITADDWEQDTRHIRIEVRSNRQNDTSLSEHPQEASKSWSLDSLPYQAGDVASILPANSPKEVSFFLHVLPKPLQDLADCELTVEFASSTRSSAKIEFAGVGYAYWPSRCTLRGWLTYCADIHALPEREDLRALGAYCSMDHPLGRDQRDKLVSLSETKAASLYADYILREKRSWADVLYDFDSLRDAGSKLTVEVLFGLLPPIRTRDFSIASSPSKEWLDARNQSGVLQLALKKDHFAVELCVAIVEGKTRLGRSFHGLCSHYLGTLKGCNSTLRLWIRPGSFHGLPLQVSRDDVGGSSQLAGPVMFVGSGTGIAPLRGMIMEREAVLGIHKNCPSASFDKRDLMDRENILVFGCRKKDADFYYEKEWRCMQEKGRLSLHTAFSRDQWHKIYVQQVLGEIDKETKLLSRHILEYNGSIYIAGGPKMARAIKEKIIECLGNELDGGEKQALQLLGQLQRLGRFSVEAWT